jgi:epoxyqueuosine reductase QueG
MDIASVERFEGEAEGYRPAELFPGAKSVISIGVGQFQSYMEKAPNAM